MNVIDMTTSDFLAKALENNFIAASANFDEPDPAANGLPIAKERCDHVELSRVMSNSFGFGGTNACLIFDGFNL